jgi:hypothetical protein
MIQEEPIHREFHARRLKAFIIKEGTKLTNKQKEREGQKD